MGNMPIAHPEPQRPWTRRNFLEATVKAGAAAFTTGLLPNLKARGAGTPNVLLILLDDMQPLLGCYGHSHMHTPHLDGLAARGTVFNRAYCQYPQSNPSRVSMLLGLRPDTTGVKDGSIDSLSATAFFRELIPDAVTLPQHFKAHGYHTQGLGKIAFRKIWDDDQFSWSLPSWRPRWVPIVKESSPSWAALDVADNEVSDGKTAEQAARTLAVLQHMRFFLAVGFRKPHFPLRFPKKYYDLYDPETFELPMTSQPPEGSPAESHSRSGLIRAYRDLPDGDAPFSESKILELIHAYAACISFIDAQVGVVLQQIEALGLYENTIVVVAGDHGHHIGDHGFLGKDTLFEVSLRSPLIISVPGQASAGTVTDALVELVDIYPTLCEACDVPTRPELEGRSLMPVVEQPTRPWKIAAFSQLRRYPAIEHVPTIEAYSIRTSRYRYTEWGPEGSSGVELYDYETDPYETRNTAMLEENSELVAVLKKQLNAGWWAALPGATPLTDVSQRLPYDINNDGGVDIRDLILVSDAFGESSPENPKVDVNADGNVDIVDLAMVAAHLDERDRLAPSPLKPAVLKASDVNLVEQWLTAVHLRDDGSTIFRRAIANLEALIDGTLPTETVLLPNYPNPFNPETWIPYDLGQAADVHIRIYNATGEAVRVLSLGFQAAGTYRMRARAAYWDGRNGSGERVASGIYFYMFSAGGVRTTRKMVVLK